MEVSKYRVKCVTDDTYEYVWAEESPTVCPVNAAHTIDIALTSVVDRVSKSEVSIREEETPTGGHYQAPNKREKATDIAMPIGTTVDLSNFVTM